MNYFKNIYKKYGFLIILSVLAVIAKVALFYRFMGVAANIVLICSVTLFVILLIFDIFKNKWIPAVLYFLISILMFADVSYSSFFNRYLSVSMLGAADLLTGVTESIKEIVKPKFFLLFIDNIILFITFIVYGHRRKTVFDDIEGDESDIGLNAAAADTVDVGSDVCAVDESEDAGCEAEKSQAESDSESIDEDIDSKLDIENSSAEEQQIQDAADEDTEGANEDSETEGETELELSEDDLESETDPETETEESDEVIASAGDEEDKQTQDSDVDVESTDEGNETADDAVTENQNADTESDEESEDVELSGDDADESTDESQNLEETDEAGSPQNTAQEKKQEKANIGKNKKKKKNKKKNKKKINEPVRKAIDCVLIACVIGAIIVNVTGSYALMSVSNREIFSYYTKDILQHAAGLDLSDEPVKSETEIYTGTYESEKEGPFFGVAEGRNLIVVQVESFQNFVIGAEYNGTELTPNLNKLIEDDTIYFDNYYQQVSAGNTSDAEYATNNGLYGSMISYTYLNYTQNYLRGLPVLLKEDYGYSTAVFHAYQRDYWNREAFYPTEGFDTYYSEDDFSLDDVIGMGLSDKYMFKEAVDYLYDMPQPFYGFMITLSNHHPYYLPKEYTDVKLLPEDKETNFGHYLQTVNYTDYAIGCLIKDLKKAGLYDNSIICIYGDHHGLTVEDEENVERMTAYTGREYSYETMMNIPLLIHIPGEDVTQTISTIGGQTDFMPTVASLLGFETLDTLYIGQNLLTAESGFVSEYYYVNKGSYFDDNTVFLMSADGVFYNSIAYNRKTGERIPVESCMDGYIKSLNQVNSCEYYLRNNILNKMYNEQYDHESLINSSSATITHPAIIANAGAPLADLIGTNSLEALDASYNAGYKYIKVDMSWTSDGRTVLLSDWSDTKKIFEEKMAKTTYDQFMSQKMKDNLTSMDFAMLAEWMKAHPDVYIAIDLEYDMGYFLQAVEKYYTEIKDRVLPVFSNISDYNRGDLMGFSNSIFKIEEHSEYTQTEINDFIGMTNLWAAAFPSEKTDDYLNVIKKTKFAYAYDVHTPEQMAKLVDEGIKGFFTDALEAE